MSSWERAETEAKLRARLDKVDAEMRTRTKGRGMPPPQDYGADVMAKAILGTNVGMPDSAFKQRRGMFRVPGQYNVGGWTNAEGETFITDPSAKIAHAEPIPERMANTIAHERFHAAMRPGGMQRAVSPRDAELSKAARYVMMYNMDAIQPDGGETPYWGLQPNSSAEEQIANLRGYEGQLPAGMPISQSPIADRLFKPGAYGLSGVSAQQLKDYYYGMSSQAVQRDALGNPVGVGIWEGQAPESTLAQKANTTFKRIMTKLGINTERFNNPNE